jgi:hypothetical protein
MDVAGSMEQRNPVPAAREFVAALNLAARHV